MKKLLYTLLMALYLIPNLTQAQELVGSVGSMWSYPVVYQYSEEVTWYFDLSGTTLAENEDVYIWIWSPSEPDAGNWENSSEFAHLSYEGNFVWSFTLTPTEYFSMSAQDIAGSAGFWFRLKDLTGTKQTEVANMPYTPIDSFFTADEMMRSYPTEASLDGGLSILFNSNLVDGFADATSVHMHSGMNTWAILQEYQSWLPEIVEKTKLKDMGNGFYKMDLIPSEYYNDIPEGFIMENITFLFVKDDWAGTSPELVIYAAEYIPPPPPEFRFFPLQISQKDFLQISRINNETGINTLIYTITAGSTEINGEFSGNMDEIKGFIDLPTLLEGIPNLTEIQVLVVDNQGNTIIDTTLPLKTLD